MRVEKYKHNSDFSLFRQPDSKEVYFLNGNGARIHTDGLTALIWQEAVGHSATEIYQIVNGRIAVSRLFLETTLDLLVGADLLQVDGASLPDEGKKSKEKEAVDVMKSGATTVPLVSVIVVNYNGREHLDDLLSSLAAQTWQNFETIIVDNASSDDSVEYVSQNWPAVKLLRQRRNSGFACGNNIGIRAAKGDYLFLLNNDTKLDSDCLAGLVVLALNKADAAAIVPKMMFYSLPNFINAIGNSLSPKGWGSDNFIGHLDIGQFDELGEVFSACFGAALLSRSAIEKVGLLDESYGFYYEDSDWSYRARLQGLKIYFAPTAVVYHKFNATMNTLAYDFKLYLLVGNRIRFALKNLALRTALSFTRNYLKEDVRHFLGSLLRLNWRRLITYLRAWLRLFLMLPVIIWERHRIQSRRLAGISDKDIFGLRPDPHTVVLLDRDSHPILDTKAVRRVYVHLLKSRESDK